MSSKYNLYKKEFDELKHFLDEKSDLYNTSNFISSDPIQIPHGFSNNNDIEIAAFFSSILAWGNRKMIINSLNKLMSIFGNSPYDFVMSYTEEHQVSKTENFKHRTFNGYDLNIFILSLQHIYKQQDSLQDFFIPKDDDMFLFKNIHNFKKEFFSPHRIEKLRSMKHISDPEKGSAAKRINMFLRWMVRQDHKGVDFGIWKKVPMSHLSCPLDVHTHRVGKELGLISRNATDLKTLVELDQHLRTFDPEDPVKYDFALFGLGAFENFGK